MPAIHDALRNTLDTLRLDPEAKADRHYLVTVLRRLGYSEEEIAQAMGEEFEPVQPEADEDRLIEVEYLASSDTREFERVYRSHPGAAQPAVVHAEPEPVMEAVDFVEVEPALIQFEEPKTLRMEVVRADSPEEAEASMRSRGAEVVRAFPVSVERPTPSRVAPSAAPPAPAAPAPTPAPMQPPTSGEEWDDSWEDDWQEDAEPSAIPPWPEQRSDRDGTQAATTRQVAPPSPAPVPAAVPMSEVRQEEPEPEPEAEAETWSGEESSEGPYEYKGYTLHARDVELSTGKQQRIYFFAKGQPRSGEPAAMPDGYEVRENERTGLPYLAKVGSQ